MEGTVKYIKTNDLYTSEHWSDVVRKNGGWNDTTAEGRGWLNCNIHYKDKCPFFNNRREGLTQNGEEGIIDRIFEKIGFTNKICVDLGAWDGKWLSNTYFLRKKYGFGRLLIEGDPRKKIHDSCGDERITYSLISSRNINSLLKEIPDSFDFLSIDIDGDDYWVLKALEKKPRCIILEYACGIPNNLSLVCKEGHSTVNSYKYNTPGMPPEPNGYYGANMLAFGRLLNNKGYKFVTSLADNMFFVKNEEFEKLGIDEITEKDMMDNYFNASRYWSEHLGDKQNNEWIIME